jgi:dihydroorotate dehydrogenase
MYGLLRRLLFLLSAESAHHVAMASLRALGWLPPICRAFRPSLSLPVTVGGVSFPNPVGLAAGLDKDATAVAGLFALGFGAVEVGTITPRPQPGNPRPRLFRLSADRALVNRMGFNNHGADAAARRLSRLTYRPAPLGINVGKNKDTPLDRAEEDYVSATRTLAPFADYLVVNVSSPNTPGLRGLQDPDRLVGLLSAVRDAAAGKPVFLKIDPDSSPEAVDEMVDAAIAGKAAALITTNTTVSRPVPCAEAGGLSGAPLAPLALATLRRAHSRAAGRLDLVAVGGIFTPEDCVERLRAGAKMVQIYTGFIYQGPSLPKHLVAGIRALASS